MIPANYKPHLRHSPLTQPWEPLFAQETESAVYLGVEIREAHCNARGFAHGGLLSALADNAMGLSAVRQARQTQANEKISALTVSLSLDFLDTASIGDFLEVKPELLKLGKTLAFVDCRIVCGERLIARGSASFRMVSSKPVG
jgi:uncharacterized protein (TIGR00369 family)